MNARVSVLAAALCAALLAPGCLAEGGSADPNPLRPDESTPRGAVPDNGTLEGWLTFDTAGHVTVMRVNVLRGRAAVDAAREDGMPVEGDRVPGDLYIRELNEAVTVPLDTDATAKIRDCPSWLRELPARLFRDADASARCADLTVPAKALAEGRATPEGGAGAVFRLRIVDGSVVELSELSLP